MMDDLLNKTQRERSRGWIIKFLFTQYPSPLEVTLLQQLMDSVNFPMSIRQLVRHLEFLRSEQMLRVFPLCAEVELDDVAQAKLLQRVAEVEGEASTVCVRLRTQGVNFQDGAIKCIGVARVI